MLGTFFCLGSVSSKAEVILPNLVHKCKLNYAYKYSAYKSSGIKIMNLYKTEYLSYFTVLKINIKYTLRDVLISVE